MPDPAFAFDGGPLTPLGRQIDDQIAAARVATPVKDVTQRRVPRVSIAELNQMDRDQLHERLRQAVANSDNRGPVQVVLDLIDLPRNLIFNAVAPSIAKANKEAGDSAALGLGRVTTSDILKDWGVENSVVRGIAGFVGDVALDPLTYAGPPGWGAKVITKTGSAALRKGGMAAIEAELKAVAAGAKAVNPEARRLVEAAMATKEMSGAERLANLAGTERSVNALRPKVLGEFTNSKLGKAFSKVGLNELESAGGVLSRFDESLSEAAKLGDKVAEEQIGAARGFISKFGKGTEPGLEFGKDATSAVAHIPFTDISLRVPNFTLAGRTAASNLRIARETQQGLHAMAAADGVLRGGLAGSRAANEIPDILRDINEQSRTAQQPVAQTIADLTQEIDKLRGETPEALGTRHAVHQAPISMADQRRIVGAIDPFAVEGEAGAGISKATIDQKLDYLVNGPTPTGRGAFLTDSRAQWLADPDNGARAIQAHAYRQLRSGDHVIAQHGQLVGLDPSRLREGDTWQLGNDTFTVLKREDAAPIPGGASNAEAPRTGKLPSEMTPEEHAAYSVQQYGLDPNDVTGFTPGGLPIVKRGSKSASTIPTSRRTIQDAIANKDKINVELFDGMNAEASRPLTLPDGYVREGEFYVYKSSSNPEASAVLPPTNNEGVLTLAWDARENKGTVDAGRRIVRVGPKTKSLDGTAEFDRMLPANEHSFVGTLPTMRDPNELTGPHRARVASQLTEAFGDKAFNSLPVMDAYARGWARAQGKTVEDFYKTLRIEKGGKPGEGALFDIPAWHDDKTRQVHTPAFKSWFGNSKVVDEHGKPLVVYHGTAHDVTHFDITKFGQRDDGWYGKGFYFTPDAEMASNYAESTERATAGHNVVPAYVSLKNPYVWPDGRMVPYNADMRRALHKELANAGHDGVIVPVHGEPGKIHEVVAFSSEQVKSATGNIGTFDPKNPDIRFQRGGAKGMGKPRGSYEMLDNGERVIRALTNPNASTLPHEVAHDFYNLLPQMDPKLAEKAAKAVGAESHAASTVQHQENFARGFEDYLRTGKAPSSELKTVFENFKQWLVDIYRSIVGTPLEGKMNPELKAVFDEMLTKDKGPILSLDPEALKLRDTLVARQQELADLRRQQKEAVDSALGLSQLSQELTDTAIQSVKPDGSITSAEQLITLGQLKRQADAAAEYARAQKSIYESGLALRADLYDKWESPTVAASTMSQTRQELFDLANRDPELAEQLSMAYGRAAEANANMAQAIGAQVAQTAANTGDRVLREVAKRALGTSDDLIGTAPMMALSRAAAATLGDQSGLVHILQTADRVNRKAFGNRSGLLAGQQKFWKRILTTGDVAAQDATRQQKILAKALTEAGKSPDARMLEQADQLLSAEVWRLTLKNVAKYHLRDFADPAKPSQLMQVFMDARKDGLYAGERGKELRKSIRSLAEQEVQRLRELGDQELADELLGVTMDSYAPIGLMPDAQRELGRVGAIMGEAGVDKPKAKESFQIQRLTNQTRYTDAEGVRRRFFEGERDFADKVTQGQWQAWKKDGTFPQHILDLSSDARGVPDKAKADGFMQIVDDVKSFDELPEEVRLSSPSLPTDPFELESLRGSRLFWITGGTADKPFFDTRWSTVSSRRLLAHERASARRSMAKLLGAQGIQVRPGSLAKIVPGEEFTTKGGVKGQVIALPNNRTGVRIGDTVFRPVEQSAGINSIFKDAFGSDLHNWIVPEQTAEVVEGIMELGKEPGQLLKLFDHMTGAWRVATLTNPSWITNNMIGNTMLGLQQRLFTPKDIADYSKDAFALHWYRGEPDVLRRMSFDVGGQKVTGEQLWNELQRHNIVGNNLINKEAAAYATADIAPWSRPWETRVRDAFSPGAIQKSMQEIPSDLKYRMQVAADARRAEGAGPNAAVDALRSTVSVGVDRYMRWFGAPFQRLNSVADDSMRTVAYLAARRRGMDGPTAAKAVLDGFIDYGDLTRFESQYLRRIVPFYAWIRNNTAIQFKTLFENPKYAAVAPKLQQAMDEAFAGEQSVPQNMRPRWMQDALAVQLGTDPEKRQALMLMSGLPQEQLYKTLMGVVGVDGFQDMLKYFGNSTHPLFQTFYGVTAGVDPFSGRTIGESGDITLPKFLLNQAVPAVPRAEQIIKSTSQGGAGAGFSRFLLGGKVQDFSQQRIDQWNLRELRKAETALRIKVARAERTGDDSLDLRAELLHVYSEMARRGVGLDTIPKWAMEELSAAGVGR